MLHSREGHTGPGTAVRRQDGAARTDRHGVDAVRLYLDDIGHESLLDRDDEVRLGETIQLGIRAKRHLAQDQNLSTDDRAALARQISDGERARREFVEANLRLVVYVAKRYRRPGVELLDLVQAGNIGLLGAVERFDWRRGNRFSTYATWWIRQAVIREMGDSTRTIRLPAHLRHHLVGLLRARDRLQVKLGHEPSMGEIAAEVDVPIGRVNQLLALEDAVSLSAPTGDSDDRELCDLVADSGATDPADTAATRSEHQDVRRLLDQLSEHQAAVLRLRYGLDGSEPRSLEDVGHALGISRERVRQLEVRALHRLRASDAARGLLPVG